jgi:glycosyltransferase involved in cell wall biosynthesis
MRVCLVSEFPSGSGAALAATRLASALIKQGVDVYFVYLYPRKNIPKGTGVHFHPLQEERSKTKNILSKLNLRIGEKLGNIKYRGSVLHRLGRKIFLNRCYTSNGDDLKKLLIRLNPDIVNVHNCSLFIGHDQVQELGREWPVFWTLHDCMAIYGFTCLLKLPTGEKLYRPTIAYTVRDNTIQSLMDSPSSIAFVAPSRWLYKKAEKVIRERKNLYHIPNCQDASVFYPEDKLKLREKLNRNTGNKLQLFSIASRLDNVHKNLPVVLKALKYKELDGRVQLNLVGDMGEDKGSLPLSVSLLPRTSDPELLRQYYAAADVTIIPSLIDNLPNTVMESLFCGTPVIGANRGGIPDMVVPGKSGWLFNPEDPDDLAKRILYCLDNKEELLQLQNNCSVWAQEIFSEEKQAKAYISFFEKTLKTL